MDAVGLTSVRGFTSLENPEIRTVRAHLCQLSVPLCIGPSLIFLELAALRFFRNLKTQNRCQRANMIRGSTRPGLSRDTEVFGASKAST
eukprot:635-Pyramimonas_sp.AAC.1